MNFEAYISTELLTLVPVLYAFGMLLKKSSIIRDKFIPLILGFAGILISLFYEFSVLGVTFEAVYTGIMQGILTSAMSVYANQLYTQSKK